MKLENAMRKRIKNLMKDKNINVWTLCKSSAVPYTTLSTFLNGKTKLLKIDTLLHLCEAFEIDLSDFFDDDLFYEVEAD